MRQMRLRGLWCAIMLIEGIGFGSSAVSNAVAAPEDKKIQPTESQVNSGRALFLKRWKEMDEMAATGDGLGPVYNARSCAECHGMVRPGGAGGNDHNVDLLTISTPTISKHERAGFAKRMEAFDPALGSGPSVRFSVTLHKFGNEPEYADWRLGVLKLATRRESDDGPVHATKLLLAEGKKKNAALTKDVRRSDLKFVGIAERSTPALFGAGLIDKIPNEAITALADSEAKAGGAAKGKVAIATDGQLGKFGWRGHTATLKEFVMGACANELGLQVPGHPQGIDPLDPNYQAKGNDLTQEQCDDMTAFVASLPRPQQRRPKKLAERKVWEAGEQVFKAVGCADCHARKVADVDGLYSDLLLHDMGAELADQAAANPPTSFGSVAPGCYSPPIDVFTPVPAIARRQWRTPPLWGVADSAPYLHDGRAATLSEAIRLHAGEASASVRLFNALPSVERQKLLAFLGSLSAPSDEDLLAKE